MNNLRTSPPKFLQKPPPPNFFMVHLLHRLYGVDAPARPRRTHGVQSKLLCRAYSKEFFGVHNFRSSRMM